MYGWDLQHPRQQVHFLWKAWNSAELCKFLNDFPLSICLCLMNLPPQIRIRILKFKHMGDCFILTNILKIGWCPIRYRWHQPTTILSNEFKIAIPYVSNFYLKLLVRVSKLDELIQIIKKSQIIAAFWQLYHILYLRGVWIQGRLQWKLTSC